MSLSAACLSALCVVPCSQSSGLHCISASVEVGNMLFTASKALLAALATLTAISKQRKARSAGNVGGQPKSKEGRLKALTNSVFEKIVASLPDQVRMKDQACTCMWTNQVFCVQKKWQQQASPYQLSILRFVSSSSMPLDKLCFTHQQHASRKEGKLASGVGKSCLHAQDSANVRRSCLLEGIRCVFC